MNEWKLIKIWFNNDEIFVNKSEELFFNFGEIFKWKWMLSLKFIMILIVEKSAFNSLNNTAINRYLIISNWWLISNWCLIGNEIDINKCKEWYY